MKHPSERAHARTTDPAESHLAAASVKDLRASQAAVYAIFGLPFAARLTDSMLIGHYELAASRDLSGVIPRQSESGIRSRRAELAALGLLEVVGSSVTQAGRKCRVWSRTAPRTLFG